MIVHILDGNLKVFENKFVMQENSSRILQGLIGSKNEK